MHSSFFLKPDAYITHNATYPQRDITWANLSDTIPNEECQALKPVFVVAKPCDYHMTRCGPKYFFPIGLH